MIGRMTAQVVSAKLMARRDVRGVVEAVPDLLRRKSCLLAATYVLPDELEQGEQMQLILVNTS
ncbi:MAG: hypothetical protein FD120_2835, partial [Gammaproteobacteria bacterium]